MTSKFLLTRDSSESAAPVASVTLLLTTVIVGPLLETLLLAAGLRLLSLASSRMSVVATLSALVWGCLHGLSDPLFFGKFFGTVWGFFVYSCAYLAWRKVSFAHAYVAAAAPHALNNLIAFLILATLASPGPREPPAVSAAQKVVLYEEDQDLKELRAVARALIDEAKAGNIRAIQELGDRLDGRPAQMLEHTAPSNLPPRKLTYEIVHVTQEEIDNRDRDRDLVVEYQEVKTVNGNGNDHAADSETKTNGSNGHGRE